MGGFERAERLSAEALRDRISGAETVNDLFGIRYFLDRTRAFPEGRRMYLDLLVEERIGYLVL